MGYKNLRRGRFSEAHRAYLVTTVAYQRKPLFEEFHTARQVILSLKHLHEKGDVISLAFVLMPDHLHWLFVLQERSLEKVIQSLKGYTSRTIRKGTPLWQEGFHDRAVRSHEDFRILARYVVANPLRAGLVADVGEYPHWDAIWLHSTLDW